MNTNMSKDKPNTPIKQAEAVIEALEAAQNLCRSNRLESQLIAQALPAAQELLEWVKSVNAVYYDLRGNIAEALDAAHEENRELRKRLTYLKRPVVNPEYQFCTECESTFQVTSDSGFCCAECTSAMKERKKLPVVSEDSEKDVELLARAICRGGICGPRDHLDEQENTHWRRFTCEAQAVIRALKERNLIRGEEA